MGWLRRKKAPPAGSLDRSADRSDLDHLREFALSRRGVEGFVEPQTTVTAPSMVLVAHDGEWTRRRVPDARGAYALGQKLGIPIYDAQVMGYPQRMREWTRRQSKS